MATFCEGVVQNIERTECIGNSLVKINSNFSGIEAAGCNLENRTTTIENTFIKQLSAGNNIALTPSSGLGNIVTVSSLMNNSFFRATEQYPVYTSDVNLRVQTQYDQAFNPTASGRSITANPTNIWRALNTVEYTENNFASLSTVNGNKNSTYVSLIPGTYYIEAGAGMMMTESHAVSLLKFTPGQTNYTPIANGLITYSEFASNYASVVSHLCGKFTFTSATGIILWNAFYGSYGGNRAILGALGFAHNGDQNQSWLTTYLPKITTAWINIAKLL